MKPQDMERMLREISGVRVGSHTAEYVVKHMMSADPSLRLFVMGGDARTGRPVRLQIDPRTLVENPKTM